ncbi:uncharacterized protein BDR25DRAFT_339026 [Lindgomyces ingoldianus]|uniref:Uncharacterized protein n=1 Tax=Lindgomyces ingoldianus TaxID=673940 RepID=A0ACB6REM7_9PLEO|nr:uncharacterized protein BDR25DRAFT_339026 [Lindgomyces ingoldianus]KAF2476931.1 hypothetical protein BDR25DRAFT_339026 [Lindgomyces ingoldianus]
MTTNSTTTSPTMSSMLLAVSEPSVVGTPPPNPVEGTRKLCTTQLDGSESTIYPCPSTISASLTLPTATSGPLGRTTTAIPSQVPSTLPGPTSKPGNNGVAGGAVAGVAIACLIIGAAIAAAIFFFLARRRKKREAVSYQQHLPPSEKGPPVTAGPVHSGISSYVDSLLPQPAEDDAMKKEVSRIRDNIKNHVRSYYHLETVPVTKLDQSQLQGLAAATGMSASALASIFVNPSTREESIRLFVAWIALSRCSDEHHPTFLPDELSSLAVVMPGKDGTNGAQASLFSKWKTITGALMQQRYGKWTQELAAPSRNVTEAIGELDLLLAPFVIGSVDRDQRHKNLEMIMSRSASLAFLLFSQPGSFRFDFTGQNGAMVVFPALLQVISDQAQTLSPPRPLWEKEITFEGGP